MAFEHWRNTERKPLFTRWGWSGASAEVVYRDRPLPVKPPLLTLVFRQSGTVWENYAPEALSAGKPAKGDFVGWSGIGPILYLLEFAIGRLLLLLWLRFSNRIPSQVQILWLSWATAAS